MLAVRSLMLWQPVFAATAAHWRSRSIYQVVTDRFARTDGSRTAACEAKKGLYCGGSWQGLENKLDYIQGMGFDAVWIKMWKNSEYSCYGFTKRSRWCETLCKSLACQTVAGT